MSQARKQRKGLMSEIERIAALVDKVMLEEEHRLLDGQARMMANLYAMHNDFPKPNLEALDRKLFKQELMRAFRKKVDIAFINEPLRPKFSTKGAETCRASGKS